MTDNRFEVKVTPAQFQEISKLAITLDIFPERKETILDILTGAWSNNGGFFVPSIARERPVEEIKLTVVWPGKLAVERNKKVTTKVKTG